MAKAKKRTDSGIRRHGDQEEVMREKGYITILEAAVRMGVSDVSIRNAAKLQKFESERVGDRTYVEFKSFTKYAGLLAGKIEEIPEVEEE